MKVHISHHSMTDEDIDNKVVFVPFETTQKVMIQTQIIFVNKVQQLIIQTLELTKQYESCYVYIKTLRIYDEIWQLQKTIVCEQVFSEEPISDIIEVSFYQIENQIFYFKRTFKEGPLQDETIPDQVESKLQLYAYDFDNLTERLLQKETLISKLQILKRQNLQLMEKSCFILNESDHIFQKSCVSFSQYFGDSCIEEMYKAGLIFMTNKIQMLILYVESYQSKFFKSLSQFKLFKIKDLFHEIYCSQESQNPILNFNFQVCANTIESKGQYSKTDVIILISDYFHAHIHLNSQITQKQLIEIYPSNEFLKYRNPLVQFHNVIVTEESDEKREKEFESEDDDAHDQEENNCVITQHYLVNNFNEIKLLYPNYSSKFKRYDIIDQIEGQNIISKNTENSKRKKIIYQHINHMKAKNMQISRDITSINSVLNLSKQNKIKTWQSLQIVIDSKHQIVYITDPRRSLVILLKQKQIYTENVFHCEKENDQQLMKKCLFNQSSNQFVASNNQDKITKVFNSLYQKCVFDNYERYINQQTKKFAIVCDKYCLQEYHQIKINYPFDAHDCGLKIQAINVNIDDNLMSYLMRQAKELFGQCCNTVEMEYFQHNDTHFVFIFGIVTYRSKGKYKNERMKSYVFVTKTNEEMIQIQNPRSQKQLFDSDENINILVSPGYIYKKLKPCELQCIHSPLSTEGNLSTDGSEQNTDSDQSFDLPFKEENNDVLNGQQLINIPRYTNVKLQFESVIKSCNSLNYVCFIYQEYDNPHQSKLLVYDMVHQKILENLTGNNHLQINPKESYIPFLETDQLGQNPFKLCRTSEIKKDALKKTNEVNYQVFSLLSQSVGVVICTEYNFVFHSNGQIKVSIQGLKYIMMSRNFIEQGYWREFQKFTAFSYQSPTSNQIEGCQIIFYLSDLATTEEHQHKYCIVKNKCPPIIKINMIEGDSTNLYSKYSKLTSSGKKKMALCSKNEELYIDIISAKINDEHVQNDVFSLQESLQILTQTLDLQNSIVIPDIEYILLNTFKQLKENYFFVRQDLLDGLSICDICICDYSEIKKQIYNLNGDDFNQNLSAIGKLLQNDPLRIKVFKQIDMYPIDMIINYDINFETTISKAFEKKAFKPLQLILDHVLNEEKEEKYSKFIMFDLLRIIKCPQLNINKFFQCISRDDQFKQITSCNIRKMIQHDDFKSFSNQKVQTQNIGISQLFNLQNIYKDLCDNIIEREKELNKDDDQNIDTQNWYIDFLEMIIGQKVKLIKEKKFKEAKKYIFDEIQLSEFIQEPWYNDKFYQCDTVQKLIDFQYINSQRFFKILFYSYLFLFIIPYASTLIIDDTEINQKIILFCLVPQFFFLIVELIQIKQSSLKEYLSSAWNWIDIIQILSFVEYAQIILYLKKDEDEHIAFKALKISLIIFSFIKTISLIRVFERMALFIKLVGYCLRDLTPFIQSYLICNVFFTFCYATLDCQNDPGLDSAVGLTSIGRLSLSVWRNSIGKLSFAYYPNVMIKEDAGFIRTFNIYMIWFLYFTQIMWMFCMMLNFMIAVIEDTYGDVDNVRQIHIYKNKAELNNDFYLLKDAFLKLGQYRILLFKAEIEQKNTDTYQIFVDEIVKAYIDSKHRDIAQMVIESYNLKQSQQDMEKDFDFHIQCIKSYLETMKEQINSKIEEKRLNSPASNKIISIEKEKEKDVKEINVGNVEVIDNDNKEDEQHTIELNPIYLQQINQEEEKQPETLQEPSSLLEQFEKALLEDQEPISQEHSEHLITEPTEVHNEQPFADQILITPKKQQKANLDSSGSAVSKLSERISKNSSARERRQKADRNKARDEKAKKNEMK